MIIEIQITIPDREDGFYGPLIEIRRIDSFGTEWQGFDLEAKVKFPSRKEALKFAATKSYGIVADKYGENVNVGPVVLRLPLDISENELADVGTGLLEISGGKDVLYAVGDDGKLVTFSFNSHRTMGGVDNIIRASARNSLGGWFYKGISESNTEPNKLARKYKVSFGRR